MASEQAGFTKDSLAEKLAKEASSSKDNLESLAYMMTLNDLIAALLVKNRLLASLMKGEERG